MPQGDIVKPGGVLEIALFVPDPVQGKSGLGHSSVYEYLKTGRNWGAVFENMVWRCHLLRCLHLSSWISWGLSWTRAVDQPEEGL